MNQVYALSLVDITGKAVLQLSGNSSSLQKGLRSKISTLTTGAYLVRVSGGGFSKVQLINK